MSIAMHYGGELSIFQKMVRRKPLMPASGNIGGDDDHCVNMNQEDSQKLKRVLGVFDIIAFGIAIAVGSGIFVIAGEAGKYSGAGLFLSFIIGGVSCLFSGLAYAEFSTRVPVSGSAYTYAYCSFGEIIGFLIGWNLTLEYGISAATIAQGWSFYLQSLLHSIGVPSQYLLPIFFGNNMDDVFTVNISSGFLIISMTLLLMKGIRESATFTNLITVWNILLIIAFIIAGCFFVDTNNWFSPCDQSNNGCSSQDKNSMFPLGVSGVLRASGIVFFSYVGFDSVSTLAEETKNPKRDMVIGILGTLATATTLYVGVSLVLLGMVPFFALNANAPLSQAFMDHGQKALAICVSVGALTTTTATTLTCLIGQPRIFYKMSHDGLFFTVFKDIKYATLISGIMAAFIGTFINFNLLAQMISVGTLMAYMIVCGGVIVMRYEDILSDYKVYVMRRNRDNLDEQEFEHLDETKYDNVLNNNLPILVAIYASLCIAIGFVLDTTNVQYPVLLAVIGAFILVVFALIVYVDHTLKNVRKQMSGMDLPALNRADDRVFLCPFCPYFPCLGIFVNAYMIASLQWESFARVLIWFIFGFVLYLFYGSKHSELNFEKYANPNCSLLEDEQIQKSGKKQHHGAIQADS